MTELTRGFFEQQYQRALVELDGEFATQRERAKDELNDRLHAELQRQMKVSLPIHDATHSFITFRISRRRREMYILVTCVSEFVCLSAAASPHYCTDPDVTWGMVAGAP